MTLSFKLTGNLSYHFGLRNFRTLPVSLFSYSKSHHVVFIRSKNLKCPICESLCSSEIWNLGHFKKNMHMASGEKYIFHMLFQSFHITPRISDSFLITTDLFRKRVQMEILWIVAVPNWNQIYGHSEFIAATW